MARRISVSAAVFVLICFFLPWVQLSCLTLRESASGFDLARSGDRGLWLVPLSMLATIILGLSNSVRKQIPALYALMSTVGGSISAFIIYREYSRVEESALVAAQWTALFWLSFLGAIAVAVSAVVFYSRRSRSP